MYKIFSLKNKIYPMLKFALGVCLAVTVTAQIIMALPFADDILPVSGDLQMEGIHTGQIELRLADGYQPSARIKVLVNGVEAASLASSPLRLTVMNNSAIEIDGRQVSYPFEVEISPVETYVQCDGAECYVDGGITRLSRVFFVTNN